VVVHPARWQRLAGFFLGMASLDIGKLPINLPTGKKKALRPRGLSA
jgi:hypothetical protein